MTTNGTPNPTANPAGETDRKEMAPMAKAARPRHLRLETITSRRIESLEADGMTKSRSDSRQSPHRFRMLMAPPMNQPHTKGRGSAGIRKTNPTRVTTHDALMIRFTRLPLFPALPLAHPFNEGGRLTHTRHHAQNRKKSHQPRRCQKKPIQKIPNPISNGGTHRQHRWNTGQ